MINRLRQSRFPEVFLLALLAALSARADEVTGLASFYSVHPPNALTAAHRRLPFGTWVRVRRLDAGKSVTVRINDRGPFIRGRIIDISRKAAQILGMLDAGVSRVTLEVVDGANANEPAGSGSLPAVRHRESRDKGRPVEARSTLLGRHTMNLAPR
jgi:rare lipoprotein A